MKNSGNATIFTQSRTWCGAIGLAAVVALNAGCTPSEKESSKAYAVDKNQLTQSAFRFRSEVNESLNSDTGWAAPANENISVLADSPFRIRFEVENTSQTANTHVFGVQYKYNDDDWVTLQAEDFPYPKKEYEIDFSDVDDVESKFNLIEGKSAKFVSQQVDDEQFLTISSDEQPVLAIANYNTLWEAVEFGVNMRLTKDNTAGVVFGFENAQNYYRTDVTAGGDIKVIRVKNGEQSVLSTQPLEVKAGQWITIKILRDGSEVEIEYEWDDIIKGITFTVDAKTPIPASKLGVYLPADSAADFDVFEVSGNTYSPRTSIITSHSFEYGQATDDLLTGSALPFVPGAGISYGQYTPEWSASSAQGEWEFPIVIRYFFDGAQRNLTGDTFAFRLVDETGTPLQSSGNPTVKVIVPEGHLGGTFVETPIRVGPWEASNGDLYILMEPAETDNMMMVVKSEDGGKNWFEVDGAHRPKTGDLEGVSQILAGDKIHTLHQTSEHVFYHLFNTSDHPDAPDTWAIIDENLASPVEPPTQVSDIAVRSDGSVVGVYGDLHKLRYKIRSADGEWGEETVVDANVGPDLSGPILVLGKDDEVHLAYTGSDGSAWYRKILSDGTLTERAQIASNTGTDVDSNGAILPLVYLPQIDTVSIVYRLENGELWERAANSSGELSKAVQVTSHAVVTNAADSEQVGADAIGFGTSLHVLYIQEDTGNIYYTYREQDGSWQAPKLQVDNINGLWVRGQLIKQNGQTAVYGYIYDAGSYGGSGMNKYAEIPLKKSK